METASAFYCSSEWHFARLHGDGATYAPLIYSLALHLSKKSGIFSASVSTLAEYFGANEKTIRKAIHILDGLQFFEVASEEPGTTVAYRVRRHKEWADVHPGRCTEKNPDARSLGADTLGATLYAISAGRFKPYPNFVKGIRKTGHSEDTVCALFRQFVRNYKPTGKQWSTGFAGKFIKHLRKQRNAMPRQCHGSAAVPGPIPDSGINPSQVLVGVPLPKLGTSPLPKLGTSQVPTSGSLASDVRSSEGISRC